MLVVCVGLLRSASTLQYNIARDIVCNRLGGEDIGYSERERHIYKAISTCSENDNAIIKTHNYHDFYRDQLLVGGKAKFLCTFRDLREVVVSTMRAYNNTFANIVEARILEREMEKYYKFKQLNPVLMQNYNDIMVNLKGEIVDIGKFLGVDLSEDEVLDLQEKYKVSSQKSQMEKYNKTIRCKLINLINRLFIKLNPTSKRPHGLIMNWDRKTALHYNHISEAQTNWRSQLTEEQKSVLKAITSDWLIDVGFEKDDAW